MPKNCQIKLKPKEKRDFNENHLYFWNSQQFLFSDFAGDMEIDTRVFDFNVIYLS